MEPFFQREFRELGHIERWEIVRTINRQNVAAHSYYVCLYAQRTMDMLGWHPSYIGRTEVLEWAIFHDVPEAGVGDIPGHVKRRLSSLPLKGLQKDYVTSRFGKETMTEASSDEAAAIVAFADTLEQVMFVAEELQMGNKTLGPSLMQAGANGLRRENVTDMVMKHLRIAWNRVIVYNKSGQTPDYMWRTYIIQSIIDNFEGYSYIIQDLETL